MAKKEPYVKKINRKKPSDNRSLLKPVRKNQDIQKKSSLKKSAGQKIPSRMERLIQEYLEYKTGNPVDSPTTIKKIRQAVQTQKAGYWNTSPHTRYDKGYDVFAYLAYHAPVYLVQFRYILKYLDKKGILPNVVSLLDLGTGPGIVPLATIWFYKERKKGRLKIHAIEKSEEFLEAFRYLVTEFIKGSSNITTGLIKACDITCNDCTIQDSFTIISCQNVLAELSHLSVQQKASILINYVKYLSDDGLLIIIEPAELRHSIELRKIQEFLKQSGLFLYAPCPHLYEGECNYSSCWSFIELSPIIPTALMKKLAGENEGYRFINTDIKFSYAIFTKRKIPENIPVQLKNSFTPLNYLEEHLGGWVDITGAKMSEDIGDRNFAVFLICDGASYSKTYFIIPRSLKHDEINYIYKAEYGEIIAVRNVRVRWNDKKSAYNLISGVRTRVSATNI
ncbi:MAG: hypothetical protein GXY48_00820 [Methanomicrobiales archaeon]|nr:hypothetical protein [Methanomicrobiales archaeon]